MYDAYACYVMYVYVLRMYVCLYVCVMCYDTLRMCYVMNVGCVCMCVCMCVVYMCIM